MIEKRPVPLTVANEKLNLEATEVDIHNQTDLEHIRTQVNGYIEPEKLSREIKKYAEGIDRKAFISKDGEKVVGYVEVNGEDDSLPDGADREKCKILAAYAHLARIGVLEEYRGKHVGKKLLKIAEEWVKENQDDKEGIWLGYLPGTQGLEDFYRSAGYVDFEEFKDGDRERLRRIAIKRF